MFWYIEDNVILLSKVLHQLSLCKCDLGMVQYENEEHNGLQEGVICLLEEATD